MKMFATTILSVLGITLLTGCSSISTAHQGEFGIFAMPGTAYVSSMSREQLHSAIEVAFLDGQLTAEQASRAHMQLDMKGYRTHGQVAVINPDRLVKREAY